MARICPFLKDTCKEGECMLFVEGIKECVFYAINRTMWQQVELKKKELGIKNKKTY